MVKTEQPILQTVMTLEDLKEAYDEAHLPKGKIKRKADEVKLAEKILPKENEAQEISNEPQPLDLEKLKVEVDEAIVHAELGLHTLLKVKHLLSQIVILPDTAG